MSFQFTPDNKSRLDDLVKKYPNKQAALLPALWMAQRQNGYLSLEVQEHIANELGISPVHVHGVVTFYTMFKQKPVGRFHLQLCRTLSCALCGCEHIVAHLKEKYKLKEGEITPDGRFSLELVECLASCGTGPMMQVNEAYFEGLTIEKVDLLMQKLMKE
ncbi:MAG: NAD(P)H-dependent oxidoreductase subunit E [Deltaproteobacteria bacterium]|nr:NAD(P)H-dependent oxidoreductase subunit E [Deltaproteobacteria bacterium]